MKRTQENFLEWAEEGMKVTFALFGGTATGGTLEKNKHGAWCVRYYRFMWEMDCVKNLQPCKVANQSHHRKPSPESELVGSCTLLKKWKWWTRDADGDARLATHKPVFNEVLGEWECDLRYDTFNCWDIFSPPPTSGLKPSQCIYRRQGDKWVHVGGK